MLNQLRLLISDESGATAIEYGCIMLVVTTAVIGGMIEVGNTMSTFYNTTRNAFSR